MFLTKTHERTLKPTTITNYMSRLLCVVETNEE